MTHHDPSLSDAPSLLTRLLAEGRALITAEIALAKSELSRNLQRAGNGLVFCVVAALLGLAAFHVLAAAAALGLAAAGLPLAWAVLIVGGVLIAIAIVCFLLGRARLSVSTLKPTKTLKNVKADIETLEDVTRA
jgi:hypothetical protein